VDLKSQRFFASLN